MGEEGTLDDKARLGENPSMLGNFVSMTPGGVTFMGFNSYQEKFGTILAVDGVKPSRENILNGAYKLAATYYLTLAGRTRMLPRLWSCPVRGRQSDYRKKFYPFQCQNKEIRFGQRKNCRSAL